MKPTKLRRLTMSNITRKQVEAIINDSAVEMPEHLHAQMQEDIGNDTNLSEYTAGYWLGVHCAVCAIDAGGRLTSTAEGVDLLDGDPFEADFDVLDGLYSDRGELEKGLSAGFRSVIDEHIDDVKAAA